MILHDKGLRKAGTVVVGLVLASFAAAWVSPVLAGDDEDYDMEKSWSDKLGDSVKGTFEGLGKSVGLNKPVPPPVPESPSGCPTIAILDGTQSQRVMAAGATGNEGVRYQYSIHDVGRECSQAGGRMAVKVGADGRVLLGPVGTAGQFAVPIRVVIFDEAAQRPVESRLYRVSAAIPAGQASAPFQFVSDNITVPVAAGRSGMAYSIKIGIDGAKGGADPVAKPHHRHQKPMQSASQ